MLVIEFSVKIFFGPVVRLWGPFQNRVGGRLVSAFAQVLGSIRGGTPSAGSVPMFFFIIFLLLSRT